MKTRISVLLIFVVFFNLVCSFNVATAAKIVPGGVEDGIPDVLVFGGVGFNGAEYGMTEYIPNKIITGSLDAPVTTELSEEEYLVVNVAIKDLKNLRAFGITLEYDDKLLIPMAADSQSIVKAATASQSLNTEELFFKTPEITATTGSLLKTRNHFIPGKTEADNGTISVEVISTDFAPADLTAIGENYYAIGAFVFGYAENKSKEDLAEDSISIATDASVIAAHSGITVPHALYLADSACTLDYEYYSLEETGYNGITQKDISLDFDISTYTPTSTSTPEPTLKPGDIGFTETFDGLTEDFSQKKDAELFNEATDFTLTASAYGSWPIFFANGTKVENGALTITGEGNATTEDYIQAGVTKVYNSGHLYYDLPEGFEAGTVTVDVTISAISGNRVQLFNVYTDNSNSGAMYTNTGDGKGNDDNLNLLATLGSDGNYHLKAVISRKNTEDNWSVAAFDTIGNVPLKAVQTLTGASLDRVRIVSATPGTTSGSTPSVTIDEVKVKVEYPEKAVPTPTPAPIYYEGYENVVYDFGTAFDLPVYSKFDEEDITTYTYDITESSLVSGDAFERELLRDTYVLNFLNEGFKTNVRLGQNMNAFYLYNETAGLWVEIIPSEYFHDVAHGEEVEDPGVYYLTVNIISNSFNTEATEAPMPELPYYEGYENIVYDFGTVFNLPVYSKLVEGDITTYTYDITESSLVIGDTFARTELRDAYVLNFLNSGFKTNVRLGQNMNAFYLYNETAGLWVEIIPSEYFHDVAHGEEVEDPGVYYLTIHIVKNTIDLGPTPTPSPTPDPSTDPASNANLKAISVSGISAVEVVPGKYTYEAEAASNYASHVIWATKSVSASKVETAVVDSEEEIAEAVYADKFRASFTRLAEGETKIVLFRVTSSNSEVTNVYKVVITRPGEAPTPTATPEPEATPAPTQTPTPAPAANANLKAISVSGISAVEVVPGKYTYEAEAASNYASHVIWATKSVSASKVETAVVNSEEEIAEAVYADKFRASFTRLAEGETKIVLFRVTSSNGTVTNVYKVVITRPGATPTPTPTPEPLATPEPTQAPTLAPASNANLKAFFVSGISAVEVAAGQYTYTAEAADNYAKHVIWVQKANSNAKVETAVVDSEEEIANAVYADKAKASFDRLPEGATKIILFRVTSQNGTVTNVYKVTITNPSAEAAPTLTPAPATTPAPTSTPTPAPTSNANLKAISVSGISAIEVVPGKYTYEAEAMSNYASHVIWATKAVSASKVETAVVDSEEEIAEAVYADKFRASFARLAEGETKIVLFRVTSSNGAVTNVYKVVITRP